jgi:hypothetical protein
MEEIFLFIVALSVLGPIAKGIGSRIARGGRQAPSNPALESNLQATEQRLAETESRLAAVEEKLDFYEKLLANPANRTKS